MNKKEILENQERLPNLRAVTQDDANLLFGWINEPEVRINSINPKTISWEEHVAWLTRKLSDDSSHIYILDNLGENIGVIRFDKTSEGFVISYSIDKNYRGKGFGTLILQKGIENICKIIENPIFIGEIKKENIASEKAFIKLGFILKREETINNVKFGVYQKQNEQ